MKQTALTKKCQEILYKYNLKANVNEDDEIQFLLSVFENHNEWESKNGVGIQSISIMQSQYGNRCFQLNRIDGTYTDISFTQSIKKPSKISDIKRACRHAIREEVIKYRNDNVQFGKTVCPFSNEVLTKLNTHIDHYDLTFDEMFKLWVSEKDINLLYAKVNETKDNEFETYFIDDSIKQDFRIFHNSNSKLRAVSKNANLSTLKYRNELAFTKHYDK